MLQELIVAAVNDALRKVDEETEEQGRRHHGRAGAPGLLMSLPASLQNLIDQFKRLPGVGAKSAQRLAFHVLKTPREDAERLCDAIRDVKDRVTYCSNCNNITDLDPCVYCADPARDHRVICVVEEPQNVNVIEKTGGFRGVYHVLLGALSPLQGVGPDDLKIKGLLTRIDAERRRGDHPRHQSDRRRRGDGDLPGAPAQAARRARHAHRDRHSRWQRSRIRRRADDGEGDGRAARGVSA